MCSMPARTIKPEPIASVRARGRTRKQRQRERDASDEVLVQMVCKRASLCGVLEDWGLDPGEGSGLEVSRALADQLQRVHEKLWPSPVTPLLFLSVVDHRTRAEIERRSISDVGCKRSNAKAKCKR